MIRLKAPSDWQTGGLERRSYYVYFTGQSLINSFVGSCLTTYFVLLGLDAFWFIYAMIPTLGYLAAYIAWRFYNLKDSDVQIMAQCNSGAITREEAESRLSKQY